MTSHLERYPRLCHEFSGTVGYFVHVLSPRNPWEVEHSTRVEIVRVVLGAPRVQSPSFGSWLPKVDKEETRNSVLLLSDSKGTTGGFEESSSLDCPQTLFKNCP